MTNGVIYVEYLNFPFTCQESDYVGQNVELKKEKVKSPILKDEIILSHLIVLTLTSIIFHFLMVLKA